MVDIRVEFPRHLWDELQQHLLHAPGGREDAAYLLAAVVRTQTVTRLLVREIHKVPDKVASKGHTHVTVDPDFIATVVKRARQTSSAVILTHSHPFSRGRVGFSGIDDGGERELVPRLQQRVPGLPHAAIVFGQNCYAARAYEPGRLESVLATVRVLGSFGDLADDEGDASARYSRQHSMVDPLAQRVLSKLRIAIVGLGGTGSHLAQQLTLLGARQFIFMDYDTLDESNLNRVVYATEKNIGRPKVEIAADASEDHGATVERIHGDVQDLSMARRLLNADIVFSCTDTMSSRTVLNRLVHQAFIPLIDTGIELAPGPDGRPVSGVARAETVLPDEPCLECRGILGIDRTNQNYGQGEQHAISVVHLNAMTAALAIDMFVTRFLGAPTRRASNTSLQYRVLDEILKPYEIQRVRECSLCTEVLGWGEGVPLPCRQDR